jgi:chemotaxis protein methyltransferase CheR
MSSVTSPAAQSATPFDYIRSLVLSDAGIVLESGKEYLVESRLTPVAKREGLPSIAELVSAVRTRGGDLRRKVVEAMTTNETTFYRDGEPFEFLEKHVLPKLIDARRARRQLRIWYAAASTGQEPYSVSMLIREQFPELLGWQLTQLGTDYSRPALDRARKGRYSQVEINRGLPAKLLVKYFAKQGLEWEIHESVRAMVKYDELNLNAPWPALGQFDIIFIRNVMIYFDLESKKRILNNIHKLLPADGYLFLGAAETTFNLDERFVRCDAGRAGCYQKAPAGAGAK